MTQSLLMKNINYIINTEDKQVEKLIKDYVKHKNIYILTSDSISLKDELLNALRFKTNSFKGELIIFSDVKRYGRKYVFNNSKVVEYYHGNYRTYDKFLKDNIKRIYTIFKKEVVKCHK